MNGLLDYVKDKYGLKSDRALAHALGVVPPVVSKWRSGQLKFGANGILRIHDATGMTIREIKARMQ